MLVIMTSVINSFKQDASTNNWADRSWEIGKEVVQTATPFLALYKPFSFPLAIGTGALRIGSSVVLLAQARTPEELFSESFRTAIAVISLAGTIFAHPLGLLISTSYDVILELYTLSQNVKDGKSAEALQSCLKIVSHILYLSLFVKGSLELALCFFAVQMVTGLLEARHEFAEGRYIATAGHVIMTALRGAQLGCQVQALEAKFVVGKLAEKWQFPSDHLPVGAQVGNARVVSWNILNDHFMSWVTEKDSQGLNGSMISQLDNLPSQKYPQLTMRDELVMDYLLQIINDPVNGAHLILALQECSPEFIRAFQSRLPLSMGIVLSDPQLKLKDHNIVIYNREAFTYVPEESAIALAFPNTDPKRTLMDLMFIDNASQEKMRVINAHLPGDPLNPGTFDYAHYLMTNLRQDCTTIALGDMNFTEEEMQLAFDREGGAPFRNLVGYNTNIGANTFEAKSIDHIWVNTKLPCAGMQPNEVLSGLQSTVDLLTPTYWRNLEAAELELIQLKNMR